MELKLTIEKLAMIMQRSQLVTNAYVMMDIMPILLLLVETFVMRRVQHVPMTELGLTVELHVKKMLTGGVHSLPKVNVTAMTGTMRILEIDFNVIMNV